MSNVLCLYLPHAAQVSDDLPEDALSIADVAISEAAEEQLRDCWAAKGAAMRDLYPEFSDFLALITQVLARDVRSVHQRLHVGGKGAAAPQVEGLRCLQHSKEECQSIPFSSTLDVQDRSGGELSNGSAQYQLVLQSIRIWYSISQTRRVHVERAEPVQ